MNTKDIIGYFHICQKNGWKKSFDLIFSVIKSSGLYNVTKEIRIGIVNDFKILIKDERLNDPKFKIIFCKSNKEYERPTILHMRIHADVDQCENIYWYIHSKGISHFGNNNESCIIDWINYMLYWNIKKWRLAIRMLLDYDTYGCNAIAKQHYSGNFWWTKSSHLKKLPVFIDSYYTAPEDYICKKNDKMFNIHSSGLQGHGHYKYNYNSENYYIPDDFNIDAYYNLNKDLKGLNYSQLIDHWLKYGKNEGKKYKDDFDIDAYYNLNKDLHGLNYPQLIGHWFKYGKYEGRKIKYK